MDTMAPINHIRRSSAPDVTAFSAGDRYPHKIHEFELGITLRFRRSRKRSIYERGGFVRTRELFCWICEGSAKIGYVSFIEYYIEPMTLEDDFLEEMDIPSAESLALAETILSCWYVFDVALAGSVVELHRVWMAPHRARDGLWARVANHFISGEYSEHGALLLLKAFPLEYGGNVITMLSAAFEGRRRAMFRHYRRHLGVELLPGLAGEEGWMWKPLSKGTPGPFTS